jgi:lysophospholipase L1-like esterase
VRITAVLMAAGTILGGGAAVILGAGGAGGSVRAIGAPQAGTAPAEYYLALGDSLAAGIGSNDGKGYVADILAKEQKSHPGLVLENLSCSGATTTSMIDGPGCSYATKTQLGDAEAFLAAHSGQVAFITIDIGGNDVDGCTSGTTINEACVTSGLNTVTANLPTILSGLSSAGGTTPIVGMSYYDPFLAGWLLGTSGESFARQSVTLLDDLNNLLQSDYGAADTAAVAHAFKSSDFAAGGNYEGTKVPVNVGRICNWTLMCSEENIHADDTGHAHIAKAFEKILGPLLAAGRRGRP